MELFATNFNPKSVIIISIILKFILE